MDEEGPRWGHPCHIDTFLVSEHLLFNLFYPHIPFPFSYSIERKEDQFTSVRDLVLTRLYILDGLACVQMIASCWMCKRGRHCHSAIVNMSLKRLPRNVTVYMYLAMD